MTRLPPATYSPPSPTLVVLNGASSSGKTSLLRALQAVLTDPWLETGLDKFLWMLPRSYLKPPLWQEVFEYEYTAAGTIQRIWPGSLGNRLVLGMHRAQSALLEAGHNLLADHVLLDPAWLTDCAMLFRNQQAYLVGVRCPLPVLEAREQSRQDRTLGQARAQDPFVHAHGVYDFEVDTSRLTVDQAAAAIVDWLASNPMPFAVQKICERIGE